MSTSGVAELLRMLAKILDGHEARAGQSSLVIIPVIVDDLPSSIDVITAAIHQAGGVVLNTSRHRARSHAAGAGDDFRKPVEGTLDPVLASTLSVALRVQRADGVRTVQMTKLSDGLIDAHFSGSSELSTTGDSDPVLAVARALFSNKVCNHELAALVYDEADLDRVQLRACWELSAYLQHATLGAVRTLVLLSGAPDIEVPRHVKRDTGVHWALRRGRMIERKQWASTVAAAYDICRSSAPFIVLFLGAGFSASSGLALGNDLRDRAIRAVVRDPDASSEQLALDFYHYLVSQGRLLDFERNRDHRVIAAGLTLERVLREEYRRFNGEPLPTLRAFADDCARALEAPGQSVRAVRTMIRSSRRLVLCTVNFDELIEHDADDNIRVFARDEEFEELPRHLEDYLNCRTDAVPLLKLHGTIIDLDSCVATDERTLLGLPPAKENALQHILKASDSPIPWLYVGASMRDTDLVPLLGHRGFAAKLREYWVMPYSVPSVEDFVCRYRTEHWAAQQHPKYEQRLITETADVFLDLLAQEWCQDGRQVALTG